IYLDILELKRDKPVVASVVTALSGGYYIAVGADYIYTSPSSMVGNVGVIGIAPESHTPSESNLETGPHKVPGFSKLLFPFNISSVLESFAGAVEENRGNRLRISSETLRRGSIYIGIEAINAGLADEVGALQKAAEHAAAEAGIDYYKVVDIVSRGSTDGITTSINGEVQWKELTIPALNELNPPPAVYYLYLPTQAYRIQNGSTILTSGDSEEPMETKKGRVVVDLSHGNKIPSSAFHILSAELAMRGVYTAYVDTWSEVEEALPAAAALVVAAPIEPYTFDEFQIIKEFVSKGRVLFMFYDPASEYNGAASPTFAINSLANRYGLTFARGYLYNMVDNYGLYRNVYLRNFRETNITQDLESLVLFTATHLHPTDSDAAWAGSGTYSSISEQEGNYAPITIVDKGNGTTAAFGDLTFITDPYVRLEDNYKLIMNLVSVITEIRVPVVVEPEEPGYNVTKPDLPVGTVKKFSETVDGDESEMVWTRLSETETTVERPDRTTIYAFDEEGHLLSWVSDGMEQIYDDPVPDFPYPLIEDEGWAFRVGYNLSYQDQNWRGLLESHGRVVGFEYIQALDGEDYWCAKISVSETDELDRVDDILTIQASELIWVSSEAGLVKAETELIYYIDGTIALEESRSLLLKSIDKDGD
ncbi:MAG: S49 family peptidase, partial [Candidatus Bathyarchaeota archaeon]